MIEDSEPQWVVVVAKPSSESVAEGALREAGHRVYVPRYRRFLRGFEVDPETGRRKRTAGHGKPVLSPAMSPYLFADWWPDAYGRLVDARGVRDVLRMVDQSIALVSERAVDIMRTDENAGKFDEPRCRRGRDASRYDLDIGSHVRIGGIVATLEKLGKRDRAVISYMLFGREIRTEVDAMILEVA